MGSVSLAGKVQTVLGPIVPEDLGVTMTHEHLLSSFDGVSEVPEEASREGEIRSSIQHRDPGLDSSRARCK